MGQKLIKLIMAVWRKIAPLWFFLARIASARVTIVFVSILAGVFVTGLIVWASMGGSYPLIQTSGIIADQQRDLIIFTTVLGMVVVIPVFILLVAISMRYRASNPRAEASYAPDYEGNTKLELVWWGIPLVIIVVLSIITAITTFALDPYKPLESSKKPVNVQVVAMTWKWLFIYPDTNTASVQELVIPEDTPINFTITADAPMNSFWIPALAGQVYAMNGMSTKLHIMAEDPGEYWGTSANLSGDGFSDMQFTTTVLTEDAFADWSAQSQSSELMGFADYTDLSKPSVNPPVKTYKLTELDLYNKIIMKYMAHGMSH